MTTRPDPPSFRRKWVQSTFAFTALRVTGQGGEFLAFVVIARRIGAGDFGVLWLAFLVARYLGLVGDWGASMRGARDVASEIPADRLHALVRLRTRITVVLTAAFALSVAAIQPTVVPLCVCILARGLNRDWMSLGVGRGRAAGLPATTQGLVLLAASILVSNAASASAAIAAAYAVALATSLRLNRLPAPSRPLVVGAQRLDGWMLIGSLADQVALSADSFLVGALVSVHAAGIYGAVYRVPNAASTIVGLLAAAATAGMVHLLRSGEGRRPEVLHRFVRASALGAIALALAAPAAGALVVPLYGEEFRPGRNAAVVLVLALAVTCLCAPFHSFALACHQDRSYALRLVAGAVVNVTANVLLIPKYGTTGAALATLISSIALLALMTQLTLSISDDRDASRGHLPTGGVRRDGARTRES